ncbi:MAG: type II secretion system protein GspM [Methylicorpusculum sp.]|uniref:type II secretion system protein GspM n=1 Tax=Methylicorpusculum sp. TaxID=2713644 RepID=UPI002727A7A3|nr:type II secretion system protein GspM [Methylicorpusculum sp.]MDO8845396.1 type II secretion system protein GspM [Methylicorpusculum sp.]MDO8940054.1 type II secretion system protein GspM [Methylicorpusculum sp.]MDO9239848.1 type II secretion system protein GspM [Methylicorpusculum sp.]MDP2201435.1 type II secretion system protein GspM [Methylicorpusculum sp.]
MIKLINKYPPQRWLAVGLLIAVILMVIGFLIVPLVNEALDLRDEKNELLFRLERYQRVIAKKEAVLANIDKIKQADSTQNYFSSQGTEALASADLQQFIKTAIANGGGQLTSTQVLPSKIEGEFTRIAVKVRMSGDIETLRSVLFQIESSIPLFVIDDLDIRPERGIRNRITRKIEPSNKLNISFQASSFMGKGK